VRVALDHSRTGKRVSFRETSHRERNGDRPFANGLTGVIIRLRAAFREREVSRRNPTIAFLVLALGGTTAALAQLAPQASGARPIRFLVAYGPASSDDFHARVVADKLPALLGRPVVVDNRPSAGGILAFDLASKSPPDGSTILLAGANITILPNLRKDLPFDAPGGFTPISQLSAFQLVLNVHPSVPAKTVADIVRLARQRPGELRFGSSGVGATPHLSGELLKSLAKIDIQHIPYKGGAVLDVIGGRIEMVFGILSSQLVYIRAGKLRALGVTGTKRAPQLPEVPTIAESGVPGYELTSWFSVMAPGGMAPETVATLNAAVRKAVAMPDVNEKLAASGVEPRSSTAEELRELAASSYRRFGDIIRKANIQPE